MGKREDERGGEGKRGEGTRVEGRRGEEREWRGREGQRGEERGGDGEGSKGGRYREGRSYKVMALEHIHQCYFPLVNTPSYEACGKFLRRMNICSTISAMTSSLDLFFFSPCNDLMYFAI